MCIRDRFVSDKVKKLFTRHGVFSTVELESRYEILLEDYIKAVNIEALTTLEMAKQEILPACLSYTDSIVSSVAMKNGIGIAAPNEKALAEKLSAGCEKLIASINAMDDVMANVPDSDTLAVATYYKDTVLAVSYTHLDVYKRQILYVFFPVKQFLLTV